MHFIDPGSPKVLILSGRRGGGIGRRKGLDATLAATVGVSERRPSLARLTRRIGPSRITTMRRVKIIMVGWPILFTLLIAPFLHTHLRLGNNRTLQTGESRVAVVHAHFPEAQGALDSAVGRHADLDHSTEGAKSYILLALLTPQSPTVLIDMRVCGAAAPVAYCPLIASLERVNASALESIHDPPGLRRLAFRAPPASYLI